MTFSELCEHLTTINGTTLRLHMTSELADVFNKLQPEEIEPACSLLLGRLAPKYEALEFNFADKMMMRALATFVPQHKNSSQSTEQLGLLGEDASADDQALQFIKAKFRTAGDLGDVAAEIFKDVREDSRSVMDVFAAMKALALEQGAGSQDRKIQRMIVLLKGSNAQTARYIVRIVLSTLRLGFSDMTILDALSWAKFGDKSLRKPLELAYQMQADIGKLAALFLTQGLEGLENIDVELGVPVSPALCQRLHTADEMIEKMGKVYVEPKYDGTRVLIHINKKGERWQVRTFTRNLEESSGMFPELPSAIDDIDADQIILDSEAVGYDPDTGDLLPFQQTIQRKRKHGIEETSQKIPLRFFVFDVLYLNGKSLLHKPLSERKEILKKVLDPKSRVFVQSPHIITEDPKELREYHAAQLGKGLEGAVIKQFNSVYQPGRRGFSWVKFKEEEGTTGQLSDTIDCLVIGYYTGQGKRTKFGVGAFLVAVRDAKSDTYKTVAKIGTGLVDAQWVELKERCDAIQAKGADETYIVPEGLKPDVWVKPSLVVEIAADAITDSPLHSAEKALRFPRLVKFRDDKKPEQVTTLKELGSITMA